MSLPPALLQRLAQRGLVQKQKQKDAEASATAENEEVIAEDYDEMETEEQQHGPEKYDHVSGDSNSPNTTQRKRTEDNFWLERMKARMGEAGTAVGYKGCPNKYNIWHKCTLFCLNRWAEGQPEPSRDYMRRFLRLRRKYPLPKGWTEIYDPGCACFYFCSPSDNLVSWLPPTHPKSQVTKSAAVYRRQLEEASGDASGGGGGSDGEQQPDDEEDELVENSTRHQREVDEIINASLRPRSPNNFPSLQSSAGNQQPLRKQKSRDLDRTLSRQRQRDRGERGERGYGHHNSSNSRRRNRGDADALDPMDPSSYSDIPRGKWSDGLQTANDERKKAAEDSGRDRSSGARDRHANNSDNDGDDDDERDYR